MNCESNASITPGLERSCGPGRGDWVRASGPIGGIERLEAWFAGHAYAKHRHDSYVIGVTESGVQAFDYRGAALCSLPGEVLVLHPDETHDGRAAGENGFGYRALYVEPARIAEAAQAILSRPCALPFVRRAVSDDSGLARTIRTAFRCDLEPLALDALILRLTEELVAADASLRSDRSPLRLDLPALERARARVLVYGSLAIPAVPIGLVIGFEDGIPGGARPFAAACSGNCSSSMIRSVRSATAQPTGCAL